MKQLLRRSVNMLPYPIRHLARSLPGVAAGQRWLINRVLASEPFVHTINAGPAAGLRFEVHLPLDKAVWAGTYETEFAQEISRSVSRDGVCFDVGAYRGYMSGVMALAGASKVIAFEPLPSNQDAVRRLCELNPTLPIELWPVALGRSDGAEQLNILADSSMAKLATSSFQKNAMHVREILVDVRRIDALVEMQACLPPDLIKIDVEGAELDVLQGAATVLRRHRPPIFLEAHSDELERRCLDELTKLGYHSRRLRPRPKGSETPRHLVCLPK
jgi:FkbM family methyltransferase